jgi:outer membrane protein assembly factor BamB
MVMLFLIVVLFGMLSCTAFGHSVGPQLLWKRNIRANGSPVRTSPAVYNNTVFLVGGSTFFALTADSGEILWNKTVVLSSQNYGTPGILTINETTTRVFLASGNTLYAFVAADGSLSWTYTLLASLGVISSSPAVVPQIPAVLFGTTGERLFAVDALTGTPLWNISTYFQQAETNMPGTFIVDPPEGLPGSDVVVFVPCHRVVFKINPRNGSQLWSSSTSLHQHITPHPGAGFDPLMKTLYVGSQDTSMRGIAATDATVRYTSTVTPVNTFVPTFGRFHSRMNDILNHSIPIIDQQQQQPIIIVGSNTGGVMGFNGSALSGNNRLWANSSCGARVANEAPPTIDAPISRAYVGSSSVAGLCAFDAFTGNLMWRFITGAVVASEIRLSGGVLYFADDQGVLYALRDSDVITESVSSTFSGAATLSRSHTGPSLSNDVSLSASHREGSATFSASRSSSLTNTLTRSDSPTCSAHQNSTTASVSMATSNSAATGSQSTTAPLSFSHSRAFTISQRSRSLTISQKSASPVLTVSNMTHRRSATAQLLATPTPGISRSGWMSLSNKSLTLSITRNTRTRSASSVCDTLLGEVGRRIEQLLFVEPQGYLYEVDNESAALNVTLAHEMFAQKLLAGSNQTNTSTNDIASFASNSTTLQIQFHVHVQKALYLERFHLMDIDVVNPPAGATKLVVGWWTLLHASNNNNTNATIRNVMGTTAPESSRLAVVTLLVANATPTYTNGIEAWGLVLRVSVVCSGGTLQDGWPVGYPRSFSSETAQYFNNTPQDDDWQMDEAFERDNVAGRHIRSFLYHIQSPYIAPVPEPEPPRPDFTARVSDVAITVTVALTSLSNPSGGTTIAKIGAAQRAAECRELDPDGARTNMEFGGDRYSKLRGAAAESFLFGLVPFCLFGLSVGVMSKFAYPYRSLRFILTVLHWPSISAVLLVPSITSAIQPTLSIAISTVVTTSSSTNFLAWDWSVAVALLVVWITYLAWWYWIVLHRPDASAIPIAPMASSWTSSLPFPCVLVPRVADGSRRAAQHHYDIMDDSLNHTGVSSAGARLLSWAEGPMHWVPQCVGQQAGGQARDFSGTEISGLEMRLLNPAGDDDNVQMTRSDVCRESVTGGADDDDHQSGDKCGAQTTWKSQHFFFFKDFAIPWYMFLDACMTTVVVVVTAVPMSNEAFCQVQLVLIASAYCVLLVLMNFRGAALGGLDFLYHNLINGAGAVGAVCLLAWANGAGEGWQQAFQYISTIALVIINLKILFDVILLIVTAPKVDARLRWIEPLSNTSLHVVMLRDNALEYTGGDGDRLDEELLLVDKTDNDVLNVGAVEREEERHRDLIVADERKELLSVVPSMDSLDGEEAAFVSLKDLVETSMERAAVVARDFLTEFYKAKETLDVEDKEATSQQDGTLTINSSPSNDIDGGDLPDETAVKTVPVAFSQEDVDVLPAVISESRL